MEPKANSSHYEKSKYNKEAACKFKSPDINKMYGVHFPSMKATFFCKTKERRDIRLKRFLSEDKDLKYKIIDNGDR